MHQKKPFACALFLALFEMFFAGGAAAQIPNPPLFNERFVVASVRTIHGAQSTYQAVVGNGSYGSLAGLRQAGFIDAALASGEKYGYRFVLTVTPMNGNSPSTFQLTATPRDYPRAGRISFFIDQMGLIRAADKNGGAANGTDPIIDDCSLYADAAGNERCAIGAVRGIYKAEMTFASTTGQGAYGLLPELYTAGLLPVTIAGGAFHGYNFAVTVFAAPNPSFKVVAAPRNYGVSGRRSFYVDASGIIRGADRQGGAADENDPPVETN